MCDDSAFVSITPWMTRWKSSNRTGHRKGTVGPVDGRRSGAIPRPCRRGGINSFRRPDTRTRDGITRRMRELVRQVIQALERDRPLILCQVVETRGSTPQKAGAIMVVDPDGGQIGTLGGGCVENEVKQKSLRQLDGMSASLHSFVLDHDYAWADGLICGGKMMIVSQPCRGTEPLAYFRAMDRALGPGDGFTEAVVVNPEPMAGASVGDRFLFDGAGRPLARWTALASCEYPAAHVVSLDQRPRPRVDKGVAFLPSLPRI